MVSHSSCAGKEFYRAEGLDVDYVIMKPQVAMQALIAGDVGYTTALGSTIRAALRNVPLRVVMTIADKPLFCSHCPAGDPFSRRARGKLLGISSFGAEHRHLRARPIAPLQANAESRRENSRLRRRPEPHRCDGKRRHRCRADRKRLTTSCSSERAFARFSLSAI